MSTIQANKGIGFFRISEAGMLNSVPSKKTQALTPGVVYNAARDFSISNGNPNGVWSYGAYPKTLTTNFTLCTFGLASTAFVPYPQWKYDANPTAPQVFAPSASAPWSSLRMHTTDKFTLYSAVTRWTAPRDLRQVVITGTFTQADIQPMDLNCFVAGAPIFSKSGSGSVNKTIEGMAAGTTVDFSISGYILNATTQFVSIITAYAEPDSA